MALSSAGFAPVGLLWVVGISIREWNIFARPDVERRDEEEMELSGLCKDCPAGIRGITRVLESGRILRSIRVFKLGAH